MASKARQGVTNHRKFLSSSESGILHPSGNREIDGNCPEGEPLWPPRCNDDPRRLPARSARLGVVRPAMASGRAAGRLHVRRTKRGTPSVHPMQGDEIRALRRLQRKGWGASPQKSDGHHEMLLCEKVLLRVLVNRTKCSQRRCGMNGVSFGLTVRSKSTCAMLVI